MRTSLTGIAAASAALALAPLVTVGSGWAEPAAAVDQTSLTQPGPRLLPLPPPERFERRVTHRYFPLRPGSVWVYRGSGGARGEREVVTVLRRTKLIEGIRATVVRDRATADGTLSELTFDWYAQDRRGRVWYLGENTTAYDDGATSKEGSWRAGVDGARAGVIMFGRHRLHEPYWQEYYAGHAEDQGELLDRSARAAVAAGEFRHVWITKDTSALEPAGMELKFYARGVGPVLEVATSPSFERLALVRFRRG